MKFKILRKGRSAFSAPERGQGRAASRLALTVGPAAALVARIEQIRIDLADQDARHREDLVMVARGFREALEDKAALQARVAALEQELCDDDERTQGVIAALEQRCDWLLAERDASVAAASQARETSAKLSAQVSLLKRQNADLLAALKSATVPADAASAAPLPSKQPVPSQPTSPSKRARPAPLPVRSMTVKRPPSA